MFSSVTIKSITLCNKTIEFGLIFLIIFTPLAFGTVHVWPYSLMELTVCFLVIISILKSMLIQNSESKILHNQSAIATPLPTSPYPLPTAFFLLPIVLFIFLILFQLLPLPPKVLKFISPNTYNLYKLTLPYYDTINSDSQSLQSNLPSLSSALRPLSIYPHATKTELYKILAYTGIFFLIISYNPGTTNKEVQKKYRQQEIKNFITRLVISLIIVGSFEAIYGLLEYISGHQYIFIWKKVHFRDSATGTYINRNHFAGYLAMVICLTFGYVTYLFSTHSKSNPITWRQRLSRITDLINKKIVIFIFLVLIMATALILSGSRMGIFSFSTSMILMSILLYKKKHIKIILFCLLAIYFIVVWLGINPVLKRFSLIQSHLTSETGRPKIWADTYNLMKDFPALGTGLGAYQYIYPKYKTIPSRYFYDHAHNDYLELLADTGFIGFIIVITGYLIYLFKVIKIWSMRRNPFVKGITIGCLGGITYIVFHSLTDFNLHIPANALHLSIITGIMHKTITQL